MPRPLVNRAQETDPARIKRLTIFSALHHRTFRLYWMVLLASILARNLQFVAQNWLVLQLTNSPLMLGITSLCSAIPAITLSLLGGAVADRTSRRLLYISTEVIMACLYLALASAIATGIVRIWHVLLFAFLSGCVRAIDQPTRQALLPYTIPRSEMANAVALASTVWQLSRLVGPSVAGMLIYLLGIASVFYVGTVGFLFAVIVLILIPVHESVDAGKRGSLMQSVLEGLKFIRGNKIIYSLIGMAFFNGVFGMSYVTLMPVFARDILKVGSEGYGFLQSAGGAGAVIGTMLVAYLARFRRKGWQMIIGATSFGLLLVGFAYSTSYPLSLALMLFMGLTNDFYLTTISAVLQLNLPDQFRGRVMGVYGLTWSLIPVGGTIAGTAAEYIGTPVTVAIGGVLVATMALTLAMAFPPVTRVE